MFSLNKNCIATTITSPAKTVENQQFGRRRDDDLLQTHGATITDAVSRGQRRTLIAEALFRAQSVFDMYSLGDVRATAEIEPTHT